MIATCWNQRSLRARIGRHRPPLRREELGQLDALVAEPKPHDAAARAEDAGQQLVRRPDTSRSDTFANGRTRV